MPRMGHSNPRTYGAKLLGQKSVEAKTEFPVTTRKFDVEYFAETGKIKYLDEEGAAMTTFDQRANAKKFHEAVTTIEQFEELGSYSQVAKKFGISKSAAHNHMRSLRNKKAREEKQMDVKNLAEVSAANTPDPEHEQEFDPEMESRDIESDLKTSTVEPELYAEVEKDQTEGHCAKDGKSDDYGANMDEQKPAFKRVSLCNQCGEFISQPGLILCDDCLSEIRCLETQGELEETVSILEQQWTKPKQNIEQLWKVVDSNLEIIHKLTIEQAITQAEKEFGKRLGQSMGELKA